ncbi:hypothetical protein [Stomatohabitans albus]|uniref:cell division protein FtsQ/DivIB n=1 Tax=Stomatohabitans albus TaxID=3110766 RepID=UPI00300C5683
MAIRDRFTREHVPIEDQHEAFREQAKRRAQERARRRRNRLIPVGIALVTVTLIGLFLYSPLTAVANIEVFGAISDSQRTATQTQLDGLIGRQMINLDVSEVNNLVLRQRWVEASTTTKHWPQTINIQLAVREPAVVVNAPTGEWAMDNKGFLIGPADATMSHLVRVQTQRPISETDAVGTPGLIAAAKAVEVFPPSITDYVTQWSIDEAQGLVIDMKPEGMGALKSVQVVVGDAEDIPYKTSVIEAVIQDIAKSGQSSSTIDVRVPSRPVVKG